VGGGGWLAPRGFRPNSRRFSAIWALPAGSRAARVSLVRQLDRHTGRLVAADAVRSPPLDPLPWSLGWALVLVRRCR
jgi:hypothetical protein